MHTKQGRGYDGYSMSNNARDAYAAGEMPKSKWTKTAIINASEELGYNLAIETLKNMDIEELRSLALEEIGWHHTGKHYNKTKFYRIDEYAIANIHYSKLSNPRVKLSIVFNPFYGTETIEERTKVIEGMLINENEFVTKFSESSNYSKLDLNRYEHWEIIE